MTMDKETFLKEITRLTEGIRAFQAAIRETKAQYIEENKRFNIGDKVRVIYNERTHLGRVIPKPERFAFVKGFRVSSNGEVETQLWKAKNDGTVSKQSDYCGNENDIHPL